MEICEEARVVLAFRETLGRAPSKNQQRRVLEFINDPQNDEAQIEDLSFRRFALTLPGERGVFDWVEDRLPAQVSLRSNEVRWVVDRVHGPLTLPLSAGSVDVAVDLDYGAWNEPIRVRGTAPNLPA